MSLQERTGERDLRYSQWHRPDSIQRFIGRQRAERLTYIDLDGIEVCPRCYEPLALIETTYDRGQLKPTTIMVRLAQRAQVPAALVFYLVDGSNDVSRIRRQWVWPPEAIQILTPHQWASELWSLREQHTCAKEVAA